MNQNETKRYKHIQQGLVNVPIKHHPTEPRTSNKHSLLCDWHALRFLSNISKPFTGSPMSIGLWLSFQ